MLLTLIEAAHYEWLFSLYLQKISTMDDKIKAIVDQIKSDPEKAIATIRTKTKDKDSIGKYIKEYKDFDRNQRDGQVDKIQIEKSLSNGKKVQMVKIYLNHAQNIVQTLAAFTVGKPVTLMPSDEGKLVDLVKQIWRVNRIDSKILKSAITSMSETQAAMNFYIVDSKEGSVLQKILTKLGLGTQKKEIKAKALNNTDGTMTPYFDASGDMKLFMWEFSTSDGEKTVNHTQIWDETQMYYLSDETGNVQLVTEMTKPHGFGKIPIVYMSQEEPEWYPVKSPSDRHEVALSKLGDANDYSGYPILVSKGKVKNMPDKNSSGKHFNIPIKYDKAGNKLEGSVEFLEAENAPESNKLELEKLEDAIAYGSGVPNLSLDKLKNLGNVAEKTVKLMFLATEIKAELKRSDMRTFIERCINVLIGGITTTTNTNLSSEAQTLYYDIEFNSILPMDIVERVDYVTKAVEGKVLSREKGVEILDLVDDVTDELSRIELQDANDDDPEGGE